MRGARGGASTLRRTHGLGFLMTAAVLPSLTREQLREHASNLYSAETRPALVQNALGAVVARLGAEKVRERRGRFPMRTPRACAPARPPAGPAAHRPRRRAPR